MPPINTNSSDKRLFILDRRSSERGGGWVDYRQEMVQGWAAYLAIACQIDLESFGIVLETQRCHGEEYVLAVDRLALFLLAFLGR